MAPDLPGAGHASPERSDGQIEWTYQPSHAFGQASLLRDPPAYSLESELLSGVADEMVGQADSSWQLPVDLAWLFGLAHSCAARTVLQSNILARRQLSLRPWPAPCCSILPRQLNLQWTASCSPQFLGLWYTPAGLY
jgi:hypothetical protein